ncbi:hypothetical protein HPB51_025563 [Rhipicephalus microplus]|uniref:histone acetyltransferase n=1 Tax=Rhipicephalus microplus TaxID=6941 RepID=A0A9J6DQR1_RHIMP|nr:hypothetical protein HPB51_025563 [Rhipicephalus microplus]
MKMAAVSLSKAALEAYVVSANDVVHFKLVMTTDDIEDDDIAFQPEMSHQIFGEGESIFGYRDLHVKLYYGSCSLTPYLGMSYTEKIDLKKSDGLKSFILWFIDAASYIDSDDEKWEYFVLHEKKVVDGVTCYPFAGYATVYRYYAYPAHIRPRIREEPPPSKDKLRPSQHSWKAKRVRTSVATQENAPVHMNHLRTNTSRTPMRRREMMVAAVQLQVIFVLLSTLGKVTPLPLGNAQGSSPNAPFMRLSSSPVSASSAVSKPALWKQLTSVSVFTSRLALKISAGENFVEISDHSFVIHLWMS